MYKKRKSTGETIGSDYWISYTDIMTGLLLVFIILISALVIYVNIANKEYLNIKEQKMLLEQEKKKLEEEKKALNEAINHLEQKRKKLEEEKKALKEAINQVFIEHQNNIRTILNDIKYLLDRDNVEVSVDIDNYVIHINNSTLGFDKGRHTINEPASISKVKKIADSFYLVFNNKSKELKSLDTIFIEGHTDKDPYNNVELKGNWGLSTLRAIEFWEKFTGISFDKQESMMRTCSSNNTSNGNKECYLLTLENVNHKKVFSVSGYASARPHECAITNFVENQISNNCKGYYTRGGLPEITSDNLNRRIDIRFIPKSATKEEIEEALRLRAISID